MPKRSPHDPDPSAVAERLKLTREALGMHQNDFAEGAGIEPNTYNQYERGKRLLAIGAGVALCLRYQLTLDWLYLGDHGNLPYKLGQMVTVLRDRRAHAHAHKKKDGG